MSNLNDVQFIQVALEPFHFLVSVNCDYHHGFANVDFVVFYFFVRLKIDSHDLLVILIIVRLFDKKKWA